MTSLLEDGEEEFGFFAGMDADEFDGISTDPWAIPDGTYRGIVDNAEMEKKDDGVRTVILYWKINDPGKEGDGNKVRQYFTIYDPKTRPFSELDADEKRNVMMFKRNLILGLGFTEAESQKASPQKCIGREAYLTIKNNPDKNDETRMYPNIKKVQSPALFAENNAVADSIVAGITDF